jgi:hypothetical protein
VTAASVFNTQVTATSNNSATTLDTFQTRGKQAAKTRRPETWRAELSQYSATVAKEGRSTLEEIRSPFGG